MLTGLILDFAYVGPKVRDANDIRESDLIEDAEKAQSVNKAILASGGALFVIGTIWYLIDPTTESAPQAQIVDGGATAGWLWRW